ncbi:hypothetical protein N8077_04120 [Myxococcota bacterium]|nr:hypothetical protein [Myxococcota bacterium]
MSEAAKSFVQDALISGDADTVGEKIADAVSMGLDAIAVDLSVNGENLEGVALLGEIGRKVSG